MIDFDMTKLSAAELKTLERLLVTALRRSEDSEVTEARVRRAESVSADLARQWPDFKLEITRALARSDRRLTTLEQRSGADSAALTPFLQRLPDTAYAGSSESAIDAALRNHHEALKAIGYPDEPEDLPEYMQGLAVGIGLLGLFVDALNIHNCENLNKIHTRLATLERERAGVSDNKSKMRG